MSMLTMIGEETDLNELMLEDVLYSRIHGATAGRLRFLRVITIGEQVCVWAAAPTYHVRQLAEQAAIALVPADRLQLEIEVVPILKLHEREFSPAGAPVLPHELAGEESASGPSFLDDSDMGHHHPR
ncbi:MAG: hypothetical protein ACKV0T_22865 [Planctomycetales bacterium]